MATRSLGKLTLDVEIQDGKVVEGLTLLERHAVLRQEGIAAAARRNAAATRTAWKAATDDVERQFNGMSQAAYNNAMRNLPAQFTDIAVSLQGGQKPLTVLLQQGGQIKDMFGSVGGALTGVARGIASMVNPLTLAGAAALTMGAGFLAGRQETQQFVIALEASGHQAGVTSSQLNDMAASLGKLDGVTRGSAAGALTIFATEAGVGADRLEQYTRTALAWEKATGTAADEVAKNFKKIAEDPVKGIVELNKQMGFLTSKVYEQIKALQQGGDATAAAKLAQDTYDQALATAAKNIQQNLGYVEVGWDKVKNATAKAIDAVKNFGRTQGIATELADTAARIAELQAKGVQLTQTPTNYAERDLLNLKNKEIQLQKNLLAEKNTAAAAKAAQDTQQTLIDLSAAATAFADKETKKKIELAAAEEKYGAAAKTSAQAAKQYAQVLAGIEEKYKPNKVAKPAKTQTEKDADAAKRYLLALQEQAEGRKELTAAERVALDVQTGRVKLSKEDLELAKEYTDTIARQVASEKLQAEIAAESKRLNTEVETNKSLREEVELLGQTEMMQQLLIRSRISAILLTKEQQAAELERVREGKFGMTAEQAQLQSEIDLLRERLELTNEKYSRTDSEKAAEASRQEWQKAVDSVSASLTDQLMAGGKSFGDYMKNLARTLVFRPIIEGAVGSVLGGSSGGSGDNSTASVFSMGKSLYNAFNSPGTMFTDFGGYLANSAYDLGGKAFAEGMDAVGNAAYEVGDAIAEAADTINSAGALLSYGKAIYDLSQGKIGSAIGTGVGQWFGGPIGAAIGSAIGGLVDGVFAGDSGTPHGGAGAIYQAGALQTGASIYGQNNFGMGHPDEWQAGTQEVVSKVATSLGVALDGVAVSFGKKAGYSVAFAFADDSSKDGAWGSLKIADAVGNVLVDWEDSRTSKWAPMVFADGEEGQKQAINAAALSVRDALKETGISEWAKQVLDTAKDIETLSTALEQISAIQTGFSQLGATIKTFANLTGEMETALLNTSGGIEALVSNATTYYENFYTESERMETLSTQLKDALNIDPRLGDEAKEQFRKAVEGYMEAGQGEMAAKLLSLSGSFATAADYAQGLADAVAVVAEEIIDLRSPLIELERRFKDGGLSRQYSAEDTGAGLQKLLSGAGVNIDAGRLTQTLLSATSEDVETYFREMWKIMPTDEAKEELLGLANAMLDLAAATDAARQTAAQTAVQGLSSAWSTLGSAATLAAQYSGNGAGLSAQLSSLQGSYSGLQDPAARAASLQQIVSLEQGIWDLEQQRRTAEAQALESANAALQSQLSTVNSLREAARGLRSFVEDLRLGSLSGKTEAQRIGGLAVQYAKELSKVRSGDLQAFSDIQSTTQEYLGLFGENASRGADVAFETARMAAELEASGVLQESRATAQERSINAQIEANNSRIAEAQAQFKVSEATQKLIDELLVESIDAFATEAEQFSAMVDNGRLTLEALESLPAELSGILGATLLPVLQGLQQSLAVALRGSRSLATDELPQYAQGTPYVPNTQVALLHEGELVVPKAFNPNAGGVTSGALSGLQGDGRITSAATLSLLARIARKLDQWDGEGVPNPREDQKA